MSLTFLLGGARSGKSSLAVELARAADVPVWVIATAEARDDEMRERILLHKRERPPGWETVEEPVELAHAFAEVPADVTLVLDCLSLWVANLLERGADDVEVERRNVVVVDTARARSGLTIVVSNEVGLGVVPDTALGRRYRDLLGRINATWAAAADEALFVVAGRALALR